MSVTAQRVDYPICLEQFHPVEPLGTLGTHNSDPHAASVSGRCRWLPRGKHVFIAGDPFRHVHIVVSGSFKVYATSLDGDEQVLGFFLPGDALGLEAATRQTHLYSAVALADAEVSEVSLQCVCNESSNVERHHRQELLQRLCLQTIANNYSALHSRSTKFAEQRLSSFLLSLWDRLDVATQVSGELSLTMSRQDIGDYLGLALGTISRTFSQLEKQMLLEVRCRSVQMLDPDALRRLACSERGMFAQHV